MAYTDIFKKITKTHKKTKILTKNLFHQKIVRVTTFWLKKVKIQKCNI